MLDPDGNPFCPFLQDTFDEEWNIADREPGGTVPGTPAT